MQRTGSAAAFTLAPPRMAVRISAWSPRRDASNKEREGADPMSLPELEAAVNVAAETVAVFVSSREFILNGHFGAAR